MERVAEQSSEKEEDDAGLLVRSKRDTAGGKENGSHRPEPVIAGEEQRSVYVNGDQGVWKCRHCIWTYQLSGPGIDHIQKHEGYCQVAMGTETLSQCGTYFDSPVKGVWKCRHCIWTYQLSGPGIDHIQKHEGYCQVAMGTETLSQHGTYFDSPVKGDDTVGLIDIITPTFPARTSDAQFSQDINVSMVSTHETQIYVGEPTEGEAGRRDWDVLKSIVYGGLIESVTSLSIVSSAAGGNASTLNIVALALANLIGGLFMIAHNISELRNTQEETTNQNGESVGRYWELLGRKANSRLHVTIAVLSYILMGVLPPIIYGFSFRKSDNKEYKLIAVAAASLVCISLLAIGKAHVSAQRTYIKSLAYYLSIGYAASGLSYVAGVMIHRLLDQLGLYDDSSAAPVPPSDIYHSAMQYLAFPM